MYSRIFWNTCNLFSPLPFHLKNDCFMKKIVSLFILSLFAIPLFAQKTINDANAEVRQVSSFTALHISNAFDVVITQGSQEGLAVSASDKEDVQYIKTEVSNGTLKIWFDPKDKKFWPKNRKLKAYVAVKNVKEIKASGACDLKIEGGLSASDLKVGLSGASDLNGKLTISGTLDVHLSGASDMDITGSAKDMSIDANGASDIKAYDFKTTVCKVEASGASGVKISVDKELSARLSGASSVSYKGEALIRDIKTSGASSISRKS
jgi:hypothetical protein